MSDDWRRAVPVWRWGAWFSPNGQTALVSTSEALEWWHISR